MREQVTNNNFNFSAQSTLSNETLAMNKLHVSQHQKPATTFITDFRKWDNKLSGKKSRENFADILIRIQNDLNMLGNKLDSLLMKVEKTYS